MRTQGFVQSIHVFYSLFLDVYKSEPYYDFYCPNMAVDATFVCLGT